MKRSLTLSGVLAWTIVLFLIAGCVSVVVQTGEQNAVEREIGVNRQKEKEKEQNP